jgi:hypothetical protein
MQGFHSMSKGVCGFEADMPFFFLFLLFFLQV